MTARVAFSAGLLLALPCLGAAQGLGDVAAREARKRAKTAAKKEEPARVLTNEDLDKGRPPGGGGTAATESPGGAPTGEAAPSTVVDRGAELRPFIDAVASAQARTNGLEARVRELGSKLNPMSTSFIYGAAGSNSASEELQVREALTQAEAELAEARQALAAANESLAGARQGRAPETSTPVPY